MNKDQTKLARYVGNDRFVNLVGIKLIKVDIGYALAQMEIKEKHLNGVNIVQGGAIFTLADYAFAAAANAKGLLTLALNAHISFYKPPQGPVLTAEAREITSGNKICSYNVDIFDADKVLVARFQGTGYIKG